MRTVSRLVIQSLIAGDRNVSIERSDLKKAKRELPIHQARVLLAREEVRKANDDLTFAHVKLAEAESYIAELAPCVWCKKVHPWSACKGSK